MVVAFITACRDKRQAFRLKRASVSRVAERDRGSPRHGIAPGTALMRRREQQAAAAAQGATDFRNQSALAFPIEQKEKSPGNHAIESSAEEVRILDSCTLDQAGWKVGAKRRDHRG